MWNRLKVIEVERGNNSVTNRSRIQMWRKWCDWVNGKNKINSNCCPAWIEWMAVHQDTKSIMVSDCRVSVGVSKKICSNQIFLLLRTTAAAVYLRICGGSFVCPPNNSFYNKTRDRERSIMRPVITTQHCLCFTMLVHQTCTAHDNKIKQNSNGAP